MSLSLFFKTANNLATGENMFSSLIESKALVRLSKRLESPLINDIVIYLS